MCKWTYPEDLLELVDELANDVDEDLLLLEDEVRLRVVRSGGHRDGRARRGGRRSGGRGEQVLREAGGEVLRVHPVAGERLAGALVDAVAASRRHSRQEAHQQEQRVPVEARQQHHEVPERRVPQRAAEGSYMCAYSSRREA